MSVMIKIKIVFFYCVLMKRTFETNFHEYRLHPLQNIKARFILFYSFVLYLQSNIIR